MKTQSEATINAIINLCNEKKYENIPFETDYKTILTQEDIKEVIGIVFNGLIRNEISMTEVSKKKFENDPKALRRYVVGLVNDRLRKAKIINGNVKYEYKNPGKLTSSQDPMLKSLNQLLQLHPENQDVKDAIEKRQEELKPKVEIDVNLLPDHLKALVQDEVTLTIDEE